MPMHEEDKQKMTRLGKDAEDVAWYFRHGSSSSESPRPTSTTKPFDHVWNTQSGCPTLPLSSRCCV